MTTLPKDQVKAFQDKILTWWENNGKTYPWRETTDPYQIMVSEFMLQQTQTSRVIPKYIAFVQRFPNAGSLVLAGKAEVLRYWSGLGYNRRALWLQEAAATVVAMDEFPTDPKQLMKIKGIGFYTSRAIPIFAFNADLATVDTNIRRIFVAEGFSSENSSNKDLLLVANQLVPKGRSRIWHSALMDYGVEVLTARRTGVKPLTKQGTFKDSNRQYRGRVVKYLTQVPSASLGELVQKCEIPDKKATLVMDSLVRDGLVNREGSVFKIP